MRVNKFTCFCVCSLYFQRASLAEREMSTLKEQLLTTSPGPSATSTPSTSPAPPNDTSSRGNVKSSEIEQVLTAPPSPSNDTSNRHEITIDSEKDVEIYEDNASTSIEDKNSRLKDHSIIDETNEEANLIKAKDREVCTLFIRFFIYAFIINILYCTSLS